MTNFDARIRALEAALQVDGSDRVEMVVKRAKVIEQYLLDGLAPGLAKEPMPAMCLQSGRISSDAPVVHQINSIDVDPDVFADVQAFAHWAWAELGR